MTKGRRGKDDRKQNMLAPLEGGMNTCISLLLAAGQGTARANNLPLYSIYDCACLQHTWTATRGRGTLSRRARLTGQHSPHTRHSVALFFTHQGHLKGKCHEIFCFRFFLNESSSPEPPKITFGSFRFLFKNSRRYSQVKVHHWY